VIFHLADLEADFRAFYRLTPEDILGLTGPHFLALAYRVSAYQGVMQARFMAEQNESSPSTRSTKQDAEVESTPAALQQDPVLADLIDYG
jgi:hypothetical protein